MDKGLKTVLDLIDKGKAITGNTIAEKAKAWIIENDKMNVNTSEELEIPFDYDSVLNAYGPEGCYQIANKLIEIANADVQAALNQKL